MMPHDENQFPRVSIVIAVFNEQATLARVVQKVIG
jgi:glycosyltransferase involved in cell wall biosynthesis